MCNRCTPRVDSSCCQACGATSWIPWKVRAPKKFVPILKPHLTSHRSLIVLTFILRNVHTHSTIVGPVAAASARTARVNRWPFRPSIPLLSASAINATISTMGKLQNLPASPVESSRVSARAVEDRSLPLFWVCIADGRTCAPTGDRVSLPPRS
jgi:hypothetical protein